MCGIAGIIRTDGRPVRAAVLADMAARLDPRRPDDAGGLWLAPDGAAGLVARPRAVIDHAGSHQPTAGEDGAVWVVFDGELYGVAALRAALAQRGHRFASAGDAEVLVHLYEDEGPAMLERLSGQFALAVWDTRRRRLLLARDRLGQKPLTWWHGPAGLAFASEPAALLAWPEVPRRLDVRCLGAYLRFGYVPAPGTALAGVRKMPPAHCLTFDAGAGRLDGPRRWWDIPRGPPRHGVPLAAWCDAVRDVLGQAVRDRLVADVPPAVLLSGGLDSSIVTALAAEAAGAPIRTFTARFDEAGWDEGAQARAVAHRLGTRHTEVRVRPACIETLETLVRHHGEPVADSSSLAMAHLLGAVRPAATVALSGDGGDESFGGYPRHGALAVSERLPAAVRAILGPLGRLLPARAGRRSAWNAARRFLSALDAAPLERYLAWRSLFGRAPGAGVRAPDKGVSAPDKGVLAPDGSRGSVSLEARAPGAGVLAPDGSRGSVSLEARAPGKGVRAPDKGVLAPDGSRGSVSLDALLAPDVAREALADDPVARWRGLARGLDDRPWADRAMAIDLQDYLPDDCLAKVHVASMAHGLEVRSPLLDHRVVELARQIPWDVTWRRRPGRLPEGKRVLRAAFADRLPKRIIGRGKMGFGVPVGRWLAGPYAEWARARLLDPGARTRDLLQRKTVGRLLAEHTARRADHGDRLWALLALELWMRAFGL